LSNSKTITVEKNENGVREVIILGMGATGGGCPYDAEVWGVNRGFRKCRRMDKLFMSDTRLDPYGDIQFDIHNLKDVDFPIISLHQIKGIKTRRYPYKAIVKRFGTEFFSCTICYMIAYALYKGYNYIRMYGVDMITTKEYEREKGGVEFWVGMARGMGCKVEISRGSAVCQTKTGIPYGFKIPINKELKKAYDKMKKGKNKELWGI
jgi:hypothetical protein